MLVAIALFWTLAFAFALHVDSLPSSGNPIKQLEADPLWQQLCELEREQKRKYYERSCEGDPALRSWFELCGVIERNH